MRRNRILWYVLLCCAFPRVAAGVILPPIVAQTGFNDATGIHGNSTVFNPYALDDSLSGGGNGEPGWARPWLGDLDRHIVTRSTIHEGDGALAMTRSNLFAHRAWSVPQSGQFMIEQWVRLPAGGFGYGATSSEAANGARTSDGAVWRFRTNGAIEVLDGNENGCSSTCNFENTGFVWTPDAWHRVTVLVDLSARRDYVFYFDGQPYQGADRLGFRGNPLEQDRLQYAVDQGNGWFVDEVRIRAFEQQQLFGDTDNNGKVDLRDLNNVRNDFGKTGILAGDANPFDGRVDIDDLNLVRNAFGATSANFVPEPSGAMLAGLLLGTTLCFLRWRSRS